MNTVAALELTADDPPLYVMVIPPFGPNWIDRMEQMGIDQGLVQIRREVTMPHRLWNHEHSSGDIEEKDQPEKQVPEPEKNAQNPCDDADHSTSCHCTALFNPGRLGNGRHHAATLSSAKPQPVVHWGIGS